MYFQQVDAARTWFRPIRGELAYEFDMYYFCAMLGMASKRKQELEPGEAHDILDYFPAEYRSRARLIVGTLLCVELDMRGIELTNRSTLDTTLRELLSPTSPSSLSDAAVRELNRFAKGGLFLLQEHFDEQPQSLQAFLLMYRRLVEETLETTR